MLAVMTDGPSRTRKSMVDKGLIVIRVEGCRYVKGESSQGWIVDGYASEEERHKFCFSPQSVSQVCLTLVMTSDHFVQSRFGSQCGAKNLVYTCANLWSQIK